MVFKSKMSSPPKGPKQPAFNPVLPDGHKAEVPRHVQHSIPEEFSRLVAVHEELKVRPERF
jgi:hypothetical protein